MPCYLGYRGGLLVVDEPLAADPAVAERLAGHDAETVAVSPDRPERVFVGTFDAGLHRSTDGGETFERVAADAIEPDAVTSVAISPRDPDGVWVGTEPSRVYRSTNGGESFARVGGLTEVPSASEWSFPPRPDTHHVRWIEPCPADSERWIVGIEAGALLVTPDGGETWIDRPDGSRRDNHTFATHPDAPDRVYAAAGDGYAESDDRGATWDHPQAGLDHRYVWGLAVDPADPDTVLVSAASGANAAHRRGEAYLYRKRGGSWERVGDDAPVPTGEGTHRAVLAADDEAVWALVDRDLYRTADGGDSWTAAVTVPDDYAVPPRALAAV